MNSHLEQTSPALKSEQSEIEQSQSGQSEAKASGTSRSGKELFKLTLSFTEEDVAKSWFSIISTLIILSIILVSAAIIPWWPAQMAASILGGLVMVRGFVIYHDYMHGSILADSKIAKGLFYTYGAFLLTPPSAWRFSHNYHHAHVGKVSEAKIGSFPIVTTDNWKEMSGFERLKYRMVRNPIIIACGYLTVFFFSFCIEPLLENIQKRWDAVLVLAFHVAIIAPLCWFFGLETAIFSYILPLWVAAAVGSYLFYVQHNWEGLLYIADEDWSYYEAAIESSSFLKLGPIGNWLTANIGYHHVHHLNAKIPFYRLPEAMKAIPELQNPIVATLTIPNILKSLRIKLWDISSQRMLSFREVA